MINFLRQKFPRVITRIQLNIWASSLVRKFAFWENLPTCFSTADAKLTSSLQSLPFDRCLICCFREARLDNLHKPLGTWKQRPSNCYPGTRYFSLCNTNMFRKGKIGVVCKILRTESLYLSTENISSIPHVSHFSKMMTFVRGRQKTLDWSPKCFWISNCGGRIYEKNWSEAGDVLKIKHGGHQGEILNLF